MPELWQAIQGDGAAMTDRELLDRIRALIIELAPLIDGADRNMKYHTRRRLLDVRAIVMDVEKELTWHVED